MSDNIIEIKNLTKRFPETVALNNVSVNFARGQIHGLIGRNGSGKTVLFKCICGFMIPDAGCIYINGTPIHARMSSNIGLKTDSPGFISSLSGYKNLELLASIQKKITASDIRDSLVAVGLDPEMRKPVRKYSQGMRQRLGIAQAIMEKPEILILDEPINALDKQGVVEIRALLKRLNREFNTTIIMSSHYSEDIDTLCDTVNEMDQGVLQKLV